jgi:HEAT repeat protein
MRKLRLLVPLLLVALLTALAATAAAGPRAAATSPSPGPPRAAVEQALSGYEHVFSRQHLLRLGAGACHVLLAIVGDQGARNLVRTRAVSALALCSGEETRIALEQVIRQHATARQGVSVLFLRRAIQALPAVAGTRALAVVAPFLDHPLSSVRSDAAQAVGESHGRRAQALLRARLGRESDETVRHELGLALAAMRGSRP